MQKYKDFKVILMSYDKQILTIVLFLFLLKVMATLKANESEMQALIKSYTQPKPQSNLNEKYKQIFVWQRIAIAMEGSHFSPN